MNVYKLRDSVINRITNGEIPNSVLQSLLAEGVEFSTKVLRSVDILADGRVVNHVTTAKEVFEFVSKCPYYDELMVQLEDERNQYIMRAKRANNARSKIKK